MSSGELVGTVVRVQVQREPLKPGPRGARSYDPAPLLEVPGAELGPRGLVGPGGVLDAHHADHPRSRNVRGVNGISVLPVAHYVQLRERFGARAVDGCAGENLLLDAGPLVEDDLAGTLLLETEDGGSLKLSAAAAAPPCVEFSRWLLGLGPGSPVDGAVQEAMGFLQDGRRGFYLTASGTGRVVPGARLTRG